MIHRNIPLQLEYDRCTKIFSCHWKYGRCTNMFLYRWEHSEGTKYPFIVRETVGAHKYFFVIVNIVITQIFIWEYNKCTEIFQICYYIYVETPWSTVNVWCFEVVLVYVVLQLWWWLLVIEYVEDIHHSWRLW